MPGIQLLEKVEQALTAGVHWVQYRDKSKDKRKRLAEASALMTLCSDHRALLFINDDLELAKAIDAPGLHLGQSDTPVAVARERLGDKIIIGATCHASLDLAQQAYNAGASYLAFGRLFSSHTKPNAENAPLSILAEAKLRFQLPIVAIGGINANNAAEVYTAGADSLALCHHLFSGDDVQSRVQTLRSLFPVQPCEY
jgi:thiamine-phosphate diphosphorylase